MRTVIYVVSRPKAGLALRIENGRAHVAGDFSARAIDGAVENLLTRLAIRVERRGDGTKGPGMATRIWRVRCPKCTIISSVRRPQEFFSCPAIGCGFRARIFDDGED